MANGSLSTSGNPRQQTRKKTPRPSHPRRLSFPILWRLFLAEGRRQTQEVPVANLARALEAGMDRAQTRRRWTTEERVTKRQRRSQFARLIQQRCQTGSKCLSVPTSQILYGETSPISLKARPPVASSSSAREAVVHAEPACSLCPRCCCDHILFCQGAPLPDRTSVRPSAPAAETVNCGLFPFPPSCLCAVRVTVFPASSWHYSLPFGGAPQIAASFPCSHPRSR